MYSASIQRLSKVQSVTFIDNQIKVEVDFQEDLETFPATL